MNKNIKNGRNILALITLLYFGVQLLIEDNKTVYLIWNVILAWIPLLFAIGFLKRNSSKKRVVRIFSYIEGFLWMIFYPNSIYVITDYIHLSLAKFYSFDPSSSSYDFEKVIYNYDFKDWNQFLTISMATFLSTALGFISLMLIYRWIKDKIGKKVSIIFAIVVNILAGYAIYLGRFIRFNSWDIVTNPFGLIKFVISNLNLRAFQFTIFFAALSIFICLMFYLAHYMIRDEDN
ncbi:Uncharacterized membrane protein [Clostridium cavendishii DSM 21758]|uniref:Uncharacterized membrane protein n=1 Tax=Clostridium cavendishii DSM 21758 TaxID=1121302 RepID=A0A1M6J533_9CLOT|nr:DUF1361 domain-containing protein [Clostridium cavendishii]SHJ41741.1 Uncharacterized membrane protein [Clostridium cavendishii DSM 21758]